jgi:hypothetical protein
MTTRHTSSLRVPRQTRDAILQELRGAKIAWYGILDDVEFLGRLWDLDELPSTDGRFNTARADIQQHRFANFDWEDDWIYNDMRFDLLDCPDDTFLRFLCETVHPNVRKDTDQAQQLVLFYNACLAANGVELVPVRHVPTLDGGTRTQVEARALRSNAKSIPLDRFDRLAEPGVLAQHLRRIDDNIELDPPLAIASAKELVEALCKIILDDYAEMYTTRDDMGALYKKVSRVLKLDVESVPDSRRGSAAAHAALRALVTTVQSLAELRNELGLGHGRSRLSAALTRHARLSGTSARGVTEFLLETWQVRRRQARSTPATDA